MAKFQDKERILKAAREKKEVTYKRAPIRLAADFSIKVLQARRQWQKIFQVMRTRGLQPRLLYPARLSIKIEGQIKSFPTFVCGFVYVGHSDWCEMVPHCGFNLNLSGG